MKFILKLATIIGGLTVIAVSLNVLIDLLYKSSTKYFSAD